MIRSRPTLAFALALALLLDATATRADAPPRTAPADSAVTFTLATPEITEFKLSNGVQVFHVLRPDLPIVAVHVASSRGSTSAEPGVAVLASEAAVSSAYDAYWLRNRRRFNQRGARLDSDSHRDVTSVSGETLSPNFPELADDLMEVLNADYGDGDTISAARQRRKSAIEHDARASGVPLAREALYPKAHPHAHAAEGSFADLDAVSASAMRAFWANAFSAGSVTVAIVGAVSLDEARRVSERTFGTLPTRALPTPPASSALTPLSPGPAILLLDRPGATQARVVVSGRAVEAKHRRRAALRLALRLVQSELQSRLVAGHGSSYEVTSSVDTGTAAPPFWLRSNVESVEAPGDVQEALATIQQIRRGDFSPHWAARLALLLAVERSREFETSGRAAKLIAGAMAQGMSFKAFAEQPALMARVPKADAVAAARDYLDPALLRVVVVGDASLLRPKLEALGLGTVTVRK